MIGRRARRALLGVGLLVLGLGGAAVALPPLLWGDGVDYSQVLSIEASREYQDAALLERAWALPVAARYRRGLDYQHNGSFCGPTSVVNVMRSLELGADQATILEGSGIATVLGFLPGGVTLDRLAELVRLRTGKQVRVLRGLSLAELRAELRRSNDPGRRYVANFSRGPLFGRGGGHHSPIAGYLEAEDLVLVLDVNQKYRPWLVRPARLLQAMDTVDKGVGKKRGLLLIE